MSVTYLFMDRFTQTLQLFKEQMPKVLFQVETGTWWRSDETTALACREKVPGFKSRQNLSGQLVSL